MKKGKSSIHTAHTVNGLSLLHSVSRNRLHLMHPVSRNRLHQMHPVSRNRLHQMHPVSTLPETRFQCSLWGVRITYHMIVHITAE